MQPTLSMLCLLVKADRYLKSYEATGNPNTLLQYQQMMKKYMAMANGSSVRRQATPAHQATPPASLPAVVLKYLGDGACRNLADIACFCKRDARIVQALLKKLTEQGRIIALGNQDYQIMEKARARYPLHPDAQVHPAP